MPGNISLIDQFICTDNVNNIDITDIDKEEVQLYIYNKILGKDLNYTTDVFTKISEPTSELELGESIYNTPNETVYSKKTGVLMEAQRPNNLPKNSIIDLGFDTDLAADVEQLFDKINVFEDIADVEDKRWTSIGFMIMLFIATTIIAKSWRIRIANRE